MKINAETIILIDKLIAKMSLAGFSDDDIRKTRIASLYAADKHNGQLRKSGEDYIIHPLAVANILVDWSLDLPSIICALLHDVIEDTQTTKEEIEEEFGTEVAALVSAITKISIYSSQKRAENQYDPRNSNYILQIFMSMSRDLRVMFIKIADRYHNITTLKYLPMEKQMKIAQETMRIYAPISARLGLIKIKNELNDMCFKIVQPEDYKKTLIVINEDKKYYKNQLEEVSNKIEEILKNNSIDFEITKRMKGIYSTYKKLKTFEILTDLFGIRIIVNSVIECYFVLGLIHTNFINVKDTFKDFISTPKYNLYQSLHTNVIYDNCRIEFQIRTFDMDRIANVGAAAHWKYKEGETYDPEKISNLQSFFNFTTEEDISSSNEKLERILEISKQKIIDIYDQNSAKWKQVNEDISALDLAFFINQAKFKYLDSIILNGKYINNHQPIKTGDTVKVIYSNCVKLNKNWLQISSSIPVKKYINEYLNNISSNIDNNTEEFIKKIINYSNDKITKRKILDLVKKYFSCASIKEFIDICKSIDLSSAAVNSLFCGTIREKREIVEKINNNSWKWLLSKSFFKSEENISFNTVCITNCCTKIPFLEVVGLIKNNTLYVHRYDCQYLPRRGSHKVIVLHWDPEKIKNSDRFFKCQIVLKGQFNPFVSNQIINIIFQYKGTIGFFDLTKDKIDKTYRLKTSIYLKNYTTLLKMINQLQLKGIINSWILI